MDRLRRLSRMGKVLLVVGVGAAVFGIATAVQASIPDSSGVAHGCYYIPGKLSPTSQLPGDLRVIDTDKGQHCNLNEGSVDLATTGFVTSTVNQTTIMGRTTFPGLVVKDWRIQWTCGGWVATNPTVSIDPVGGGPTATPLTLHAMTNAEMQTSGFPGTTADVWFNLSSTQNVHTQVTCVDPRVYGETSPVSARAMPTATLQP
jgi:hypothetical protein